MVIVLIRTTMRADADAGAYASLGERMDALVAGIPGYLGAEYFTDEAGQGLSVIRFASHEALAAWREHPERREAQRAGRERFYASFTIEVCTRERVSVQPAKAV